MDRKRQTDERAKRYIGEDDWISRLPDDILVDILSFLPLEEVVGTSVLSSRWINLWEHTNCLNIDGDSRALFKISTNYDKIESEGSKYVRWVNRILQSHKAPTLKEFRIKFPFMLDFKAKKSIAGWLEFAFAKHVQRLDLDLSITRRFRNRRNYCFPEELLAGAPSDSLCNFKALRELVFAYVDVTDRAIQFFLNNCPVLEQLVVKYSDTLSNVEVCGSSLVLKRLKIVHCRGLKSLRVSAPSLTYLKFVGGALVLENAPMLVETHIDYKGEDIQCLLSTLSSGASQLEILRLKIHCLKGKNNIDKLPQLPKLNKLLVEQRVPNHECLVATADLIMASPCLEEIVLEINWYHYSPAWKNGVVEDAIMKSPHKHLKVVKYRAYYGLATDLQFVSYILDNCAALEKLIIDPSFSKSSLSSYAKDKLKIEETGRNNAKQQLEALLPRHVELVIL